MVDTILQNDCNSQIGLRIDRDGDGIEVCTTHDCMDSDTNSPYVCTTDLKREANADMRRSEVGIRKIIISLLLQSIQPLNSDGVSSDNDRLIAVSIIEFNSLLELFEFL